MRPAPWRLVEGLFQSSIGLYRVGHHLNNGVEMTVSPRVFRLAALLLCSVSVPAAAQSIWFTGSTTGCFYISNPCSPKSQDLISTLQFEGGSFDATTVDGKLQFGTASNNFGLFSLGARPTIYNGLNFL